MDRTRRTGQWNVVAAIQLLLALVVTGCASSGPAYEGRYAHGAVAADHAVASEAGAQMLRMGGNAVDAAVATSFTLSVVRPESCGIGGGGFMVIHLVGGSPGRPIKGPLLEGRPVYLGEHRWRETGDFALNYREMAPAAVGPDYYEHLTDSHASTHGGMAVGIPGSVAGLLYALDRFGTLDRATVMAPAIRAAEHGFRADKHYLAEVRDAVKDFEKNPEFKCRFAFVWKRYLKEGRVQEGDWIRVPEQAAALRLIADQGAAAFYEGPIADAIVDAVHRDGGPMTREDLKSFKVAPVEPLRFTFMDRTFLTMPPPSSGGVAMAEAMGVFDRVLVRDPRASEAFPDFKRPANQGTFQQQIGSSVAAAMTVSMILSSPQYLHPLSESLKHAFADRSRWLGDPAFVEVPVARLLSDQYARDRATTFDPNHTLSPEAYGTSEPGVERLDIRNDHGTSHFCVIDQWGSAVSCTETINLGFGSCLAVDRFGFILNDQMDDFTTHSGNANAFGLKQSDRNLPAPGKRPLSSMTPTIVLNERGEIQIIAGASGGPRIISGTMQAILNTLLFDATAGQAVTWPRMHHQWSPDVLRLEEGLIPTGLPEQHGRWKPSDDSPVWGLIQRGHKVDRIDSVANVQLIKRDGDSWDVACDPRKGGRPAGH